MSAATEAPAILTVDGKPFHCTCGCNVFHTPQHRPRPNGERVYECNACGQWYAGYPSQELSR